MLGAVSRGDIIKEGRGMADELEECQGSSDEGVSVDNILPCLSSTASFHGCLHRGTDELMADADAVAHGNIGEKRRSGARSSAQSAESGEQRRVVARGMHGSGHGQGLIGRRRTLTRRAWEEDEDDDDDDVKWQAHHVQTKQLCRFEDQVAWQDRPQVCSSYPVQHGDLELRP